MPRVMHIACPACSTRYAIPDSAIGENGRVVRCAKCRHSWFQDGPSGVDPAETSAPPAPAAVADIAAPGGEPTISDHAPAGYPARRSDIGGFAPQSAQDFADTPSSFAHEPPFRPRRRNRGMVWLLAALLFAVVAAGAFAAMAIYGPSFGVSFAVPDWLPLPRAAFGQAPRELHLDFPPGQQQWRPLPNGNSFFNVSGSIVNASQERRDVPSLEITLRDSHHAIVYTLETASPKSVLAPGESEQIDQAIIDAPKSAQTADIGWKTR